jgi:hypothetical protein
MSGYPADLIPQRGVAGDSYNYLSKPINSDVLLKKIHDVLLQQFHMGGSNGT